MTHERQNEWTNEFLNGRMELDDFQWLGEHIADRLTALGVPAPTAREAADALQVDIVGLFESRSLAQWGREQLAYLDERDRLVGQASA